MIEFNYVLPEFCQIIKMPIQCIIKMPIQCILTYLNFSAFRTKVFFACTKGLDK